MEPISNQSVKSLDCRNESIERGLEPFPFVGQNKLLFLAPAVSSIQIKNRQYGVPKPPPRLLLDCLLKGLYVWQLATFNLASSALTSRVSPARWWIFFHSQTNSHKISGVVEQCLYWRLRDLRLKRLHRIATALYAHVGTDEWSERPATYQHGELRWMPRWRLLCAKDLWSTTNSWIVRLYLTSHFLPS